MHSFAISVYASETTILFCMTEMEIAVMTIGNTVRMSRAHRIIAVSHATY